MLYIKTQYFAPIEFFIWNLSWIKEILTSLYIDKGLYLLLAVWSFNVDKSIYGEERMNWKKRKGKLLIMLLDYIMASKTWNDQAHGFGSNALIFVLEKQNKIFPIDFNFGETRCLGAALRQNTKEWTIFFNYRIWKLCFLKFDVVAKWVKQLFKQLRVGCANFLFSKTLWKCKFKFDSMSFCTVLSSQG